MKKSVLEPVNPEGIQRALKLLDFNDDVDFREPRIIINKTSKEFFFDAFYCSGKQKLITICELAYSSKGVYDSIQKFWGIMQNRPCGVFYESVDGSVKDMSQFFEKATVFIPALEYLAHRDSIIEQTEILNRQIFSHDSYGI